MSTMAGTAPSASSEDKTNPMNFTENQHGNVILEKLRVQRESGKFCDVILYVENKKFHVHRNILSSFSPYFESIFQSQSTVKEKFNITCQRSDIFQCFINYMYMGSIVIDKNNVAEMFKLAHRLEVSKLKMYCAEYLERYLDLSNCVTVKDMANRYNMPLLSKLAEKFIQTHLNEVLNHTEVLELNVDKLSTFLSDKAFNLSQGQIMEIIIKWTKHDVPKREKQLKSILKLINLAEIDVQYIHDLVENDNLFVTSEMSLYSMLKYLSENGLPFHKFQHVFDTLSHKFSNVDEMENEETEIETISKLNSGKKKGKRKDKLLKSNPFARLAALRSALLLHSRLKKKRRLYSLKSVSQESKPVESPPKDVELTNLSLKCHLCDHYSTDATNLEQHLSVVHARDVTYKCGVCGFVCQWNNLYIQHVKNHFPGPPYKCDTCEYTDDKLNDILTHRSIHMEEKTFNCNQCSFQSTSQANLMAHLKCHANVQGANDRSYVCDLCGFSTKYLSHLIAHKRIHTGEVYRCSFPHCKYTAVKKSQLSSHAKSHQGLRPHCCNVCGRSFLEKSHLVRHERIHLEEKPFKCHECDYASSRRDKLKEHQARHHGDHASAKVPYKARPNKKPNQYFQDGYSDSSSGRLHQSPVELQDVLSQNHNLGPPSLGSYVAFSTNDTHVHHSPSASSASLDFHHQQLLGSGNSRGKDQSSGNHRSSHQNSAAAVAAAMMLDPRFHPSNTAGGPYATPPVSMAAMVNQAAGQVVQSGHHQVSEYPTALMSLF